MRFVSQRCACLFVLVLCACATESPPPAPRKNPCDAWADRVPEVGELRPFSIAVLPDTQFYAERYPEIFQSQAEWIAGAKAERTIEFVLHEGDIVNLNLAEQWDVASAALHSLDGVVPYVLSAGNHDLRAGLQGLTREADFMNEHFPVAMHDDDLWFCSAYEEDAIQNSYALLDGGGRKWLVLALEFGPRDAVLEWASGILSRFRHYPAILVTHAYMYLGDERYDLEAHPDGSQDYAPQAYDIEDGEAEGVNDGGSMWRMLVEPHANVQMVLSGHMLWPGVGRLSSARAGGSVTHQLLANYQTCPSADPCMHPDSDQMYRGGNGFLRMLDFSADHAHVDVTTYSPYLDQSKTDADNQFELDLTLPP